MAKNKNKNKMPNNPTSMMNRDVLQRLNFLYQASVLLNGLAPPRTIPHNDDPSLSLTPPNDKGTGTEEGDPPPRPEKSLRKKKRRVVSFEELSRSYVETMKSVGQKTNVKMCVLESSCSFVAPLTRHCRCSSSTDIVITIVRCTGTRP